MTVFHEAVLHLVICIELFVFWSLNVSMKVAEPIPLAFAAVVSSVGMYARGVFRNTDQGTVMERLSSPANFPDRCPLPVPKQQTRFFLGPHTCPGSCPASPFPVSLICSPCALLQNNIFLPDTHYMKVTPRPGDVPVFSVCPSRGRRFTLQVPGPGP